MMEMPVAEKKTGNKRLTIGILHTINARLGMKALEAEPRR
jgi:hypothetical protein